MMSRTADMPVDCRPTDVSIRKRLERLGWIYQPTGGNIYTYRWHLSPCTNWLARWSKLVDFSKDCFSRKSRRQGFGLEHVENLQKYNSLSQRGQLVLAQVCLRSFHGLHRSICLWIVLALCLQTTGPWTDILLLLERRLRSCVLGCFMWFYTEAWRYIPPSCHLSWAFRHDGTMFDPSHHYGGDGMDLDALGGIGEEYVIALYHC